MIRGLFSPSLRQPGCCRGPEKPAFEGPKRGLSVTDTPAGVPAPVLFASAIENSFRRLTTAPSERTMRDDRLNERFHRFSFPRVLAFVIVGTRVACNLDDPPYRGIDRSRICPLEFTVGTPCSCRILKTLIRLDRELSSSRARETRLICRPETMLFVIRRQMAVPARSLGQNKTGGLFYFQDNESYGNDRSSLERVANFVCQYTTLL